MTKQDFLNQELFKVNETGQIYNSITGDILPNNEIWVRLTTNFSLGVKREPWVEKDESTTTPTGDTDNKYYSFGASLDTTNLTYSSGTFKLNKYSEGNYHWVVAKFLGNVLYIPQGAFGTGTNGNLYIKEIAIPNSVTWIGPKAFSNLTKLESIIFGSEVTNMDAYEWVGNSYNSYPGGHMCDDNNMLWHITCLAKNAPSTGGYTFPLSRSGQGTSSDHYELCKHYIENDTITYNNMNGPEVQVSNNINTLTIPTEETGYTSNYWSNLTNNNSGWGFNIEYCTPQEEETTKTWHFIIIPKSNRRRYIKILRIYE